MSEGSFFKLLLAGTVAFGMVGARCHLAPSMAGQHSVYRGLGNCVAYRMLIRLAYLSDFQDTALQGLCLKTAEKLGLLRNRQVLPSSSAAARPQQY